MTKLKKGIFIVSCQALADEPMYGRDTVLKMARAAIQGGAEGIRTSQINNIKKIIKENFNVPIIGLVKKQYLNSDVYITPTIKELKQLIETNVDIIAIDATLRQRPKENLEKMVDYFYKNKKNHQLLMADCSDYEDVENAIKLKFDIIGTTMRGYTKKTQNQSNTENDYEFLKWCVKKLKNTKIKLIAEGGFNTPQDVKKAFLHNAYGVVVGSAITRIQFITKYFKENIN
ncbi:N-acetylmannosamine-6-phosphate 2-epimerase [Mesomycoplasma neurolyticum]|uniref:Putative N-acetylmannosamine-6-phosphate 2-epimerase n=1 Tax=Mesomycoplasma neurolyticum TaxID=2120 RepID=A0A449A4X2_9BACT|nr:N-acetylmannosamine-6-phosphate 2-epimerase [Mesomycoplasma neurolyticum]VEU59288.1 N-acetylmannosamine-6-phosphate 2-epimerase [Mesomycoplasma neurolyticum]